MVSSDRGNVRGGHRPLSQLLQLTCIYIKYKETTV